ncbi:MAG: SUMF1/EgtB/PvdO family nonheme iron enzyme, partial [Anaerolineales bacterium]
MTRIFISYSRKDKALADYIARQLRHRGAEVFIDYQKLIAGEDFIGRLGQEINRADYFVLLVSPRSVASRWVRAEVAWAFTQEKPIIPVSLEPTSIHDLFFLVNLEQIDFTRWSLDGNVTDALHKLAYALNLPQEVTTQLEPEDERLMSDDEIDDDEDANGAPSITIAREDLSEIFFTANEIAQEDPEQAVFMLQQVIEIDPDFMRGQAQAFVERQLELLKPLRLAGLLERANAAYRAGEWNRTTRLAEDMLALDAKNADAQQLINLCQANLPCEPIYKQAELAAARGRWKAVQNLLADVRQTCPDYGDPAGLFLPAMAQGSHVEIPLLEWCDIPAGEIEIEGRRYRVEPFQMAKYPVTNAQFRLFIDDPNGYGNPLWWDFSPDAIDWRKGAKPDDEAFSGDKNPRVNVCWYEAVAFARWLGAVLKRDIRLPTEAEWQWAAAADTGWEYPYGNQFDQTKSNTEKSGIRQTTPVDRYPAGASPFGV